MQRLLLASADDTLVEEVKKQLDNTYQIETCADGDQALKLLREFDPDLLMVDTKLVGTDCFCVIRTARSAGRWVGILAVTTLSNTYILNQLQMQNVDYILIKPCKLSVVISQLRQIGAAVADPQNEDWDVTKELENILLDLGFKMGRSRFNIVKNAVLIRYAAADNVMMKAIYSDVGKHSGGNSVQTEKAVRDGIKAAWEAGNRYVWQMYFLPGRDGQSCCPKSEEFITRIANCLRQRSRMKLPYHGHK